MSTEFFRRYLDILNEFAPADGPSAGPADGGDDGDDDGVDPNAAIVVEPDPEKSETLAYMLRDVTADEFAAAWAKLPREYQEEFGWDLPLWDHDDLRNTPGIKVLDGISFQSYLNHVKSYIAGDQATTDLLARMRTGPAK